MHDQSLRIALDAFAALGALFALWKGGPAERAAAAVMVANILIENVANVYAPGAIDIIHFVVDGLTALVILAITIRYSALWMGGVMLFYAIQFTLHSFYLVAGRPHDNLHAWINNIDFQGMVWCLIIGAAVAWRRRMRAARSVAAPAA